MPCPKGISNPEDVHCSHGYSMGDHHWFKCMNVSPFEGENYPMNFEIKSGPGYIISGSPITEEVTATVINSSSAEPVRAVASVATIAVAVAMGILQLIAPDWVDAASIIIAILTPIVMAVFTRGKVWSPASVRAVIEEALKAAEQAKKR